MGGRGGKDGSLQALMAFKSCNRLVAFYFYTFIENIMSCFLGSRKQNIIF